MTPSPSDSLDVIAVDPGEKVGWARATVLPPKHVDQGPVWADLSHGITPLREMAVAIHHHIEKYDVLIYESWNLTPLGGKTLVGSDMKSSQFIGMCRIAGWLNPKVRLVSQSPSIKSTADKTAPPWLQEIIANEPSTHDDAHNVDALRHLWFWTWKNYIKEGQDG